MSAHTHTLSSIFGFLLVSQINDLFHGVVGKNETGFGFVETRRGGPPKQPGSL